MDPNQKEKEGEEEILPSQDQQEKIKTVKDKCCVDCNATKTPLWRSGPAGPKSLCNACGIRYRKKRAGTATATATVDLKNKEEEKIKEEKETILKKKRNGKCGKLNVKWRQRLMALGERVVLFQRRRSQLKKRQRFYKKLGEVEQAAVLLMALSCGSVFA